MISEIAIAREMERNPELARLQCYRRIQARKAIIEYERRKRFSLVSRPLDVTDAEQFPNIAEAVAHAKALRGCDGLV